MLSELCTPQTEFPQGGTVAVRDIQSQSAFCVVQVARRHARNDGRHSGRGGHFRSAVIVFIVKFVRLKREIKKKQKSCH